VEWMMCLDVVGMDGVVVGILIGIVLIN